MKPKGFFWLGVIVGLGAETSLQSILNLLNVLLNNVIPTVVSLLPEHQTMETAPTWIVWMLWGTLGWFMIITFLLSFSWTRKRLREE